MLEAVPGTPWTEATIEAAPGTLTPERARGWRESGHQPRQPGRAKSFVQREIARTGRKHTADIVAGEVAMLRECGIDNINIDLIAGLSGQTAACWRESLDWIERLAPPHVSVYMFEVDEDSRLGREVLSERQALWRARDSAGGHDRRLYEMAVARLATLGILPLRDLELCAARLGVAAQPEVLAAGALCGVRRRRAFVRRRRRWRNVETPAEYVERDAPRIDSVAANLR